MGVRGGMEREDGGGRNEEEEGGVEEFIKSETKIKTAGGKGKGGGGGGVYLESYTREARFLTRWDQHAVAQRRL